MDNELNVLNDWLYRCKKSQRLNYRSASFYIKCHYVIGVLDIVCSAMLASKFFSEFYVDDTIYAILSLFVTIFTSLQTFFKFSEKAEKCRTVSAKYGAVRRELENLIEVQKNSGKEEKNLRMNIIKKMDKLAEESPFIPKYIHDRVVKELNNERREV